LDSQYLEDDRGYVKAVPGWVLSSALVGKKYLWELTFVTLTSIRIDTEGCSLQHLASDKPFHLPISFLISTFTKISTTKISTKGNI
jgi:hypothetical protein